MEISSITPIEITPLKLESLGIENESTGSSGAVQQMGKSFDQILQSLSQSQQTSDTLLTQFSAGEDVNLDQLMIAVQQTDINFRVAMSVRDRLVDAYREVMRMTV